MKKIFKMEDLQCAVCAGKMEDAIRKLPGVESVSISFVMQQITIEASEENFPEILDQAQKCCKRFERGCRIIF